MRRVLGSYRASEVAQLKLNADWVVLSACNTIAGDKPGAEALSGLARAFFYAGTRAMLVSHWAVESKAAARRSPPRPSAFWAPIPGLAALKPSAGHADLYERYQRPVEPTRRCGRRSFWLEKVLRNNATSALQCGDVRVGSCITSIAGPNGVVQLFSSHRKHGGERCGKVRSGAKPKRFARFNVGHDAGGCGLGNHTLDEPPSCAPRSSWPDSSHSRSGPLVSTHSMTSSARASSIGGISRPSSCENGVGRRDILCSGGSAVFNSGGRVSVREYHCMNNIPSVPHHWKFETCSSDGSRPRRLPGFASGRANRLGASQC
jgi:hypothetical protein